ncbi:MAG TPA: beta-ketoacyl synthase N-terminal-like domain-containing protein [Nitrososphaerales archaeon]|nr:beta-ketoacyl synthase N-terminal-like domain-containing protein [Nitrososphaerales archaeon]
MPRSKAYVTSVGLTNIGDQWDKSILDLAMNAARAALRGNSRTKPDQIIIGNMFSAVGASQEHLGALVADGLGLTGTPAYKVEAACSSGGTAFNVGYNLVRSGAIESALVVGVEKMRDLEPEQVSMALAMAESAEYTQFVGATFAALNGLLARYYMEQMDVSRDELSSIPVLDHANAVTAEHAQFRKAITPEVVSRSSMIADPLRLFDCAPVGDGAAAVFLTNNPAPGRKGKMAEVLGGAISTNDFSIYERDDMLDFKATKDAFKKSMAQAGLTPSKLSLVETHDAFSVVGALSLEAMGFSKRGRGSKDAKNGKYSRGAELPINTFGGLKARGHPVGATGVYQIAEAYLQLTDQAGKNQVEGAEYAATQNIGGVDTTSAVHIFGRAA